MITPEDVFWTVSAVAVPVIIGAKIYFMNLKSKLPPGSQARVVVNMPVDAKPLSQLESTDTVVGDDRAVLWWTVFNRCLDEGDIYCSDAQEAANDAVTTVYGSK